MSYYEKVLELFSEDSTVLVFSDDMEWCKQQELFSDDRFMLLNTLKSIHKQVIHCLVTKFSDSLF